MQPRAAPRKRDFAKTQKHKNWGRWLGRWGGLLPWAKKNQRCALMAFEMGPGQLQPARPPGPGGGPGRALECVPKHSSVISFARARVVALKLVFVDACARAGSTVDSDSPQRVRFASTVTTCSLPAKSGLLSVTGVPRQRTLLHSRSELTASVACCRTMGCCTVGFLVGHWDQGCRR